MNPAPMRPASVHVLAAAALLAAAAGCVPAFAPLGLGGFPFAPPAADEQIITTLIGGDAERLVIARQTIPNAALAFNPFDFPSPDEADEYLALFTPQIDLVVVNLRTLDAETAAADVDILPYRLASDGRRVAGVRQVDSTNQVVAVIDLETGEDKNYFEDVEEFGGFYPESIADGRLRIKAYRYNSFGPGGAVLVEVDLDSGAQAIHDDRRDGVDTLAESDLVGDLMARVAFPQFDPATQTLQDFFTNPRLVLVDIRTGEQRVLAPEVSPFIAAGPFLVAGRVVWAETNEDYTRQEVRSVVIDSGELETLTSIEHSSFGGDFTTVDAAGQRGVLLRRTETPPYPGSIVDVFTLAAEGSRSTETFSLLGYDGVTSPLLDRVVEVGGLFDANSSNQLNESKARFMGEFVVIPPAIGNKFTVIDMTTGEQKSFDPSSD